MQPPTPLRRIILNNLIWLSASLLLALFVWVIAIAQTDPPVTWRHSGIPIRLTPPPGLIIVNNSGVVSAAVQVRAPTSERINISADEIEVWADLSDLTPGEHTIPLRSQINAPRAAVANITPRQITITLEVEAVQLKPVTVQIISQPSLVYTASEPVLETRQVEVRGPASRVEQVTSVQVSLALEGLRASFADNVRAVPVNAEGEVVSGVTVASELIGVQVEIEPRSDLREVRVQPNLIDELPDGYILTPDFDYNPKSAVLSGSAVLLNALPGTLFTEAISLAGRTSSFEVIVPLDLPSPNLLVVTGRTVTVTVGIIPLTVSRQFDRIPIDLIGQDDALEYTLSAETVTVLVTGPQPLLDTLTSDEISVVVDVSGVQANSEIAITLVASLGESTSAINVSVLPAQVDVIVGSADTFTPEATPAVSG